ncbi:MAG TPA: hypothetical protein DEA08_14190 [Planctomycetes bacterium]|nr:hypothetical protein [Planctomycetota bacterium]
MSRLIRAGVCLALCAALSGCLEGEQSFQVHDEGSGAIELKLQLGKKLSPLAAAIAKREGKEARLQLLSELELRWRGVYWEDAKLEGQTLSAKGVFSKLDEVALVGEGSKHPLVSFSKGPSSITVRLHNDEEGLGMPGLGAGEEVPAELKAELEKMLDQALGEAFGGLKLTLAIAPPGKLSGVSGLVSTAKGRALVVLDEGALKKLALSGKAALEGSLDWGGEGPAPKEFAARLKAAQAAWTAEAKARQRARSGPGEKELEEMKKELEGMDKELEQAEKELEEMEQELEGEEKQGGKK